MKRREASPIHMKLRLSSLPIVPDVVYNGGKFDYKWPTENDLEMMTANGQVVYIEKIEIWSRICLLSGIRLTLSNGMQSPEFCSRNAFGEP